MKVNGGEIAGLLVPFAVICLVSSPGSRACPRRCTCYVATEVHCTFRYLTSIPDGIPLNVERINLGYNSLIRLTETDFSGMNKLELLLLHSNSIHAIADKTFSDLRALQVLKMSYNKLRKLQKDTFYGLWSLTRLHVDHNNIEFINPDVFYGLSFLRLVHLEGNQLTKLHPDTFVSLSYLQIFKTSFIKYLYLSDNFLTSLPQEMVSYMPDLESLYLHGNPWTCDCHLKWLSHWIQEKPGVVKCKTDRNPSGPQQCPLCVNPRIYKGKPFAAVQAAAFLCVKPTIDPSLTAKSLPVLEDSDSASVSPQDFMAPFGSLTLNMTDQSGNEANMVCSIQKPSRTLPFAFTEDKGRTVLNTSFSTFLVCNMDDRHIQLVWQVLALYSDSPLILARGHSLTEAPQLSYKYKQVAPQPEDIFTRIEADLRADPAWLMQEQISLQLNRTASTLSALQIRFSSEAQVTFPRAEMRPMKHKWAMVSRFSTTRLEHTVLVGGSIALDCPGLGDPTPHVEWLLADGSKARAPYMSEDGRILVDGSGRLELQMADGFDTGAYHCVSTNYDDADILTYRITVVEPRGAAVHGNEVHHVVFTGDVLELPCHSTGVPDASISWVLPGNTVLYESSGDKQILNSGALRISQVAPKDQGQYRCVAANPLGVDFLIFQVSVEMKSHRPVGRDRALEGSGLEEPSPSVYPREPPLVRSLASAPVRFEAGKRVSGTREKDNFREPTERRRGGALSRRFREQRRPFPPSARRIDPRHWAALLKKAKKSAVPEEQGSATVRPRWPIARRVTARGEDDHSSGSLPPEVDFMAPAPNAPTVPARTGAAGSGTEPQGHVTNFTPGTEVSPLVSPPMLRPQKPIGFEPPAPVKTTATSENSNPSTASKVQGPTSHNSATVLPLPPGVAEFQAAEQGGRREDSFHRVPPVTGTAVGSDVHVHMSRSTSQKACVVLEEADTAGGPQTPVPGACGARSSRLDSHTAPELGTSTLAPDPRAAAPSRFQMPGNTAAGILLPRRAGRRRRIWGRGRIISPYRAPVLRRHRYGIVQPTLQGAAAESTAELPVTGPAQPPSQGIASATAALSFPGPPPSPLPKADTARVPTDASATLVQSPPFLSENKQDIDTEETAPTIRYFGARFPQVTPAVAVTTHTPASTPLEKTVIANNSYSRVAATSEAKGDAVIPSTLSGLLAKPSGPVTATRFPRRKIPWHQIFVNNNNLKGVLRNLHRSGLHRSAAPRLPKAPSALAPEEGSPVHSTTPSASLAQAPSATLTAAPHNATEAHSPPRLPTRKEAPFPPFYPTLPSTPSRESGSVSLWSVPAAAPAATPAPASFIVPKTQPARPSEQKGQGVKEVLKYRDDPDTSPGLSAGVTMTPAMTPPVLVMAETPIEPRVSAFTPVPLQGTGGLVNMAGLHSSALPLTDASEELPEESGPTASATPWSGRPHEGTWPGGASAALPLLSISGPPVPGATSPPSTPSAAPDNAATPASETMTDPTGPQRSAAVDATKPEAWPRAVPTPGASHVTHPDLSHSTPVPAPSVVKPQDSRWTPSPWSENQHEYNVYPESAEDGKEPGESTVPILSLPEATSRASNWDRWKSADGGFAGKPVKETTASRLLPSGSLSQDTFEKPRIVGGKAASFTVSAHSDALLPCEAVGSPPPTIHWTRLASGLELSKRTQNSRFQVLRNGTLSIQRVSIQDRGQYLCSAANTLGTAHLRVTLSVVSYPPRILESHTRELTVHSGSTVEVKCRAEGRPSPAMSWILPNQTVVSGPSAGQRRVLVASDGTLVIRNLSIYDRGFYQCIASNQAGRDSLLVKIQVIAAPPTILEQRREVIAGTWGESLKLPCTARGTPQPHVHWVLSDGTEVKPTQLLNSNLLLYSNGTLYIRNVAPADRGTYECIATSSTGSERRVVTVTVEEREMVPHIDVASQKWTEVNLGGKLLLNCSATGEPKPRIMWRLPSKAVVDQWHRMGSRIHVYPNGSLFIGSVTEKDGGDYLCVARNRMGDDLILMHVSLGLTPAKIDREQHFKKQVLHGKDFQVDCKASGSPAPEISWSLPDGTMVSKVMQAGDGGRRTRKYTLFNNGTLYLDKVGPAEEGDYTCHAQNTLGKDEMRVRLTVLTAAPRIRQGYRAGSRVQAGHTAVLDCEVTGEPKPKIFWFLPSGDMISFSRDRYTFHANGSLSIDRARPLDSGEYVCVARNPSGGDTRVLELDVASDPPLINGLRTNKTVTRATAARHSQARFDCRAEGWPPPRVTWVMPGSVSLPAPYYGSRITVRENGTLEIRNVRVSDSGDLVCVARNEGGESALVVQLEVLDMLRRPAFRNPLHERVVAQLGKATALNCSADGNPPPEIIWILPDGTRLSSGPHGARYLMAGDGSLLIHRTTRGDAGRYRCAARNRVGYIERLIVLEIGQRPVILTYASGPVRAVSGDALSLPCVSAGIPKPHVAWTTAGGSVMDRPQVQGRYTLHENGTLVIQATTARDGGNYVCKAQNSVGQTLAVVPVVIMAYPPRITARPPGRILTRTGEDLQLHCVALGVPRPDITWETPDRSLLSRASSGRTRGSQARHPRGTLLLRDPRASDSGMYRCTARNPLGSDYATTYVHVI